MAADHEKEEDEGWTRGLMQDFQAAGQKYCSIKLMPNLSSGWGGRGWGARRRGLGVGHKPVLILDILLTNSYGFLDFFIF